MRKELNGIVYELNFINNTAIVKFSDCMIQEAKIPAKIDGYKVIEIDSKAFYGCNKLKKITIPSTVIKIKNSAFEGCKKLKHINDGAIFAENIGFNCFKGCGFASLRLPYIKTLGKGAFSDCPNLVYVSVQGGELKVLEEEVFANNPSLQTFEFPSSITVVKDNFRDCSNLKSMVFYNDNLDVEPMMERIDKNVILFGEQGSKVQKFAEYGFNFMLMKYMV